MVKWLIFIGITKLESSTFDDTKQIKDKNEMLAEIKKEIFRSICNIKLIIDYQTGDRSVQLVYQPTTKLHGIHATFR